MYYQKEQKIEARSKKWHNFLFSAHLIDSCPKCGCELADDNKVGN